MTDQILRILLIAFAVSLGILMFTVGGLLSLPQFLVSLSVPVCGLSLVGYFLVEWASKQ